MHVSIQPILWAAIIMGSIGLILAAGLFIAARFLSVKEDPRIEEIGRILPGANCGGCGYAGCAAYAAALVREDADFTSCGPGGAETVKTIARILGKDAQPLEKRVARLRCNGSFENCANRIIYNGIDSCAAAILISGGSKTCEYGCEGRGDCVRACSFGAMVMDAGTGLPEINEERCTACGKCVKACPRHIIEMQPWKKSNVLRCSAHYLPRQAKQVCSVCCTGCNLCVKKCPSQALALVKRLPVRDFSKCKNCNTCLQVCPCKCYHPLALAGGVKQDAPTTAPAAAVV